MAEALPPVDESVAVPPAVKAAADRANAYYNQSPKPDIQPDIQQSPEPPAAAEAAPVQTPEPPAPAPTPDPAPTNSDEVAQLRAQLDKQARDYNALLGRNAQQRDYIALQQTQLSQLANPRSWAKDAPQQPKQPTRLITEEERKAYGDDALSVMERKAREVVAPVVEQLNEKNQRLERELQQVKANDVYSTLDAELPNWRDINRSDEWKEWLRLPDLYSGMVRQQLLNQAFAAGEAGRILAFFRGFLSESSEHVDPQGQAPTAEPPPQAPVRRAAVKLESLAAPGRAAPSPSPSATAAQPTITNKDVTHFYWQVTHGQWNGREEAKAAREAQIHAAVREGRVQFVK